MISSVAPYAACHINIEFHASVVDLIVDLLTMLRARMKPAGGSEA